MTDVPTGVDDTLRWGDQFTLVIPTGAVLFNATLNQLVKAHWRWPVVWKVLVLGRLHFNLDEAHDLTFIMHFVVGAGQAESQFDKVYPVTLAAGFPQVLDIFDLPCKDMQVQGRVNFTPTSAAQQSFDMACYVAPLTEPHAMTAIQDDLGHALSSPEGRQGGWMPPGFHEPPLRYR